ncbi:ABC transporter permease [Clostridium manihotivorum]|uniref:ABC transporter permease n=1 Tax=Clostridium manihotivorum TaxID=2320868 RepID=A0A3R5TD58_9CLOT|nr:ABC transporter permease [Clostridium manihotivorum]QAA30612.1 ABC transporter permease [Clostridium manihotivorum]
MNNFLTIFKKELMDIFRDRKTIIFSIFLPILIYPVMFGLVNYMMKDAQNDIEKKLDLGIKGNKDSAIVSILKEQKNINLHYDDNLDAKLKKGDVSLIVEVPEGFDQDIKDLKPTTLKLVYDKDSNKSSMAASNIRAIFDSYYKSIVNARVESKGLDKTFLNPFDIQQVTADNKKSNGDDIGSMMIGMLPTFIIIFMLTPTLSIAADFIAGEKERGTFEPLLSTSVSRMSIMWGKLATLATVSIIALVASMLAMGGSLVYNFKLGSSLNITPKALILISVFALFILISVCAVEMAISIYAKSIKEANSFLAGITAPVFILSYIPFMMDAKTAKFIYFHVPIVNVVVLMKEFLVGIFNTQHILVVAAWHIVYVILSLLFAKIMFSREEVIFRS